MEIIEHTVAVYRSHRDVESAVDALRGSGFDIKHLTIIGLDYPTDNHLVLVLHEGHRPRSRTRLGEFWSAMCELLSGSAIAFVPEIGQVMVAGRLVDEVESVSLSGNRRIVTAVLVGIGVPTDHALEYESALKTGRFLLVVREHALSQRKVHEVLASTLAASIDTYAPHASANATRDAFVRTLP